MSKFEFNDINVVADLEFLQHYSWRVFFSNLISHYFLSFVIPTRYTFARYI